jgi:putative oxidoreductase
MSWLFRTDDSWAGFVLRLTLGFVMLPHGLQKTLGWFGGTGFEATMGFFTSQGTPWILAFLVVLAESAGAIGLIVGLLTRLCAFGIFCVMLGATLLVHWPHGFFMNWFGKQEGEGFEYHILAMGIALGLMIAGGGKASVDREIADQLER